jgi:hypothetical protein
MVIVYHWPQVTYNIGVHIFIPKTAGSKLIVASLQERLPTSQVFSFTIALF